MRKLLLLAPALLLVVACNRTDPATDSVSATATVSPPPAVTVAEAPVAPMTTMATGVSDAPAPGEHTTFDAKAFAGEFADGNFTLRLAADGTYTLSTPAADNAPGTWTLEPDARHIRLDPESKSEDDRVYELVSDDELRAAKGTQTLHRAGTAH